MILLKKKLQKFASGGSVGIAPEFKVSMGKPQAFDPSVLFQKYGGSQSARGSSSSAAKKSTAKPKSLSYDLKGTTQGGQSTFNSFLQSSINKLSELDPNSSNYTQAYDLLQLQIKDAQTSLARDGSEYATAKTTMGKNGSSDMMAMQNNGVYVFDKATKDVVQLGLLDYLNPENKKKYSAPLSVGELARYKDTATREYMPSLFVGGGIDANNAIGYNIGEAKMTESLDKIFKGIGNITAKEGVLQIDGSDVGNHLLEQVFKDGDFDVTSSNAENLAAAFELAKRRINSDAQLRDSFTSMAINNLRQQGKMPSEITSKEDRNGLAALIDTEQNKIMANIMAKNLKIKIGGSAGSGAGGDGSGITGVGDVNQQLMALDKNLSNGEYIDIGKISHDPDKYITEFGGASVMATNFNLMDDIIEDYQKQGTDAKHRSLQEEAKLRKYVANTEMFSLTGEKLPYKMAAESVLNTKGEIQYMPQVFLFDGEPRLDLTTKINKIFETPAVAQMLKNRIAALKMKPNHTSAEIDAEINAFITSTLTKIGIDPRTVVQSKAMILVPIVTSEDITIGDADITVDQALEDNPFMRLDNSYDNIVDNSGIPNHRGWSDTYTGFALMEAKPAAAIQNESGGKVYALKSQLSTAAFAKVEKAANRGVAIKDLLSSKAIQLLR